MVNPISPHDIWSDDINDPLYNHGFAARNHTYSHEKLRRADPLYDLVVLTDWNWPTAVPGKGSAIFIHQWRRPGFPTEGCVAFERADLRWIISHLQECSRLVIPESMAC